MRILSRTLIAFIVLYCLGFPLGVGYIKARSVLFPDAYRKLVFEISQKHKLDPLFIAALVYAESSFKPNVISKSGAVGLMQIMPNTALQLAPKLGLKFFSMNQLSIPEINLEIGCLFLSQLSDEFMDFTKVLVAYNAGRSNLMRWINGGDLLSQTFPETRLYVIKITRLYRLLKLLHGVHRFN